jgi:hypothetical protein
MKKLVLVLATAIATLVSGSAMADSAVSTSVSDVAVSSGIGFTAGSNWLGGSIQSTSATAQNMSNASASSKDGLYMIPATATTSASSLGSTTTSAMSGTWGIGNVVADGGTYAGAHQSGSADADASATNYKLWVPKPVAQGSAEATSNVKVETTSLVATGLNGLAVQTTLVGGANTSLAEFSKFKGFTASHATSTGSNFGLGGGFTLGDAEGVSLGYVQQSGDAAAE